MKTLKKVITSINTISGYLSCALIFFNMIIITYNVIMRMAFNKPISGLVDIVSLVSASAAATSLGYTEMKKGFIQVDFVKEYFPKSIQHVLHVILGIISVLVIGFLAVRFGFYGMNCLNLGTATMTMRLVYWPVCFLLMLGCISYALTSLYAIFEEVFSWKEEKQ